MQLAPNHQHNHKINLINLLMYTKNIMIPHATSHQVTQSNNNLCFDLNHLHTQDICCQPIHQVNIIKIQNNKDHRCMGNNLKQANTMDRKIILHFHRYIQFHNNFINKSCHLLTNIDAQSILILTNIYLWSILTHYKLNRYPHSKLRIFHLNHLDNRVVYPHYLNMDVHHITSLCLYIIHHHITIHHQCKQNLKFVDLSHLMKVKLPNLYFYKAPNYTFHLCSLFLLEQ